MEGVLGAAAVGHGIRERPDDLVELEDRARPSVGDHDGSGARLARALVNEVKIDVVDLRLVLVEGVEQPLLGTPVEGVAPVLAELAEIAELGAVDPVGLDLVGKTRAREALAQVFEHGVGNVDAKFLHRGALLTDEDTTARLAF